MKNSNESGKKRRELSLSPQKCQYRIQQAQAQTSQTPVNSPKVNSNQKK